MHYKLIDHKYVIVTIGFSGGSRISRGGGHPPRRGSANSQGGYVSKNLYVKMKESGPLGGAPAAPPGSANGLVWFQFVQYFSVFD